MHKRNFAKIAIDFLLELLIRCIVSIVSLFPVAFIVGILRFVSLLPMLGEKEREFIYGLIGYFRRNRAGVEKVFRALSPHVKVRIVINYTGNMRIQGPLKRRRAAAELGIRIPDVLFLDITSRCNLKCNGCYSEVYRTSNDELDIATLERVLDQAQDLGIYTVFITGGEPFVRRRDLMDLCRNFRGMAFGVFTNGTLIDDALATEIEKTANMFFLVSIDGLDATNDRRRGSGTFARALGAMDRLRHHGVLFGSSTMTSRVNFREVLSDEFVQLMMTKGCTYMAYLPYFASGHGWSYDSQYLLRPDERAFTYQRAYELRQKYSISIFNSHLNFMGKCAGGGRLLYVNANGDVQPCGAVHFALHNVKQSSLREIVASDLARAYAEREPASRNPYSMCWVLDHPRALREIILQSGAHPIDSGALDLIEHDLEARIEHAERWQEVAEPLWSNTDPTDFLKRLEKSG